MRKLPAVIISLALIAHYSLQPVIAASLTSLTDTLSNDSAGQTGVSHTISFNTGSTASIQQIDIRFATTSGGSTKPAGLGIGSTTLGSLSGNLGSGWSISLINASSGLLSVQNSTPVPLNSGSAISIQLNAITNSAIGDCTNTGSLTDTCYVAVTTFSDAGTTPIDAGETTYSLTEAPFLNFDIISVSSGETHNGITSTLASNGDNLPFATLADGDVKYLTQKLVIKTNAPHGYVVNAFLNDPLSGTYSNGRISPFGAPDATWSTPQTWQTPTGSSANSDSGWFGANTTDSRVTGWSSASQKFGPISTTPHPVATSTGPDRSGSTIYITYVLGINGSQGADNYSGLISYDVRAIY